MRTKDVRKWMIERGIRPVDLKRRAEVSFPSVSMTIAGQRRNPDVLRVLRELGCPEEFLGIRVAA